MSGSNFVGGQMSPARSHSTKSSSENSQYSIVLRDSQYWFYQRVTYSYFIETLQKLHRDFAKTLQRLCSDPIETLQRLFTDSAEILQRLKTDLG